MMLNESLCSQTAGLVVPLERGGEQLVFEFSAVVGAKEEVATGEGRANVCLRATTVTAINRREGVVHLIDWGVFCCNVRHGLLLLLACGCYSVRLYKHERLKILPTLRAFRSARTAIRKACAGRRGMGVGERQCRAENVVLNVAFRSQTLGDYYGEL